MEVISFKFDHFPFDYDTTEVELTYHIELQETGEEKTQSGSGQMSVIKTSEGWKVKEDRLSFK